jgi:uncharacterized protein (TIGR02246 family)
MKVSSTEKYDESEIGAALNELADTIKLAYATGDVDLYASAFAEDAVISMPGIYPVRGIAAIRELFINRPQLPPGATFQVEPSEIEVLSAEWAYAFGIDTVTYPSADGGEESKETMTFIVLIRNTSDGWKTYREVLSANQ